MDDEVRSCIYTILW